MREQISLMLQKNAISEIYPDTLGFYLIIFLVRMHLEGGPSYRLKLKQLNHHIDAPHFRMHTISSVLSTVETGDYAFKIDLQDAYFHVLIHPHCRKYLRFAFENKVCQFRVLPFGLNTAPQVFTRLAHTVAAYLRRQRISVILYLDDWLIHHPDRQVCVVMPPVSVTKYTENGRPHVKRSEILTRTSSEYLVSGASVTLGSGRASLPISKAWEIIANTYRISSQKILSYTEVSRFMGSLNWESQIYV